MTAKPLTPAEKQAIAGYDVIPHPDGKPWDKCCTSDGDGIDNCQCLMKKPKAGLSRFDKEWREWPPFVAMIQEGGRFFCCHRYTEDGYRRECAGWAAKFGKDRR